MPGKQDKKILLIAPQPFFAERGTPLNVRYMATFLGEMGYKVKLLVYPIGQDVSIPNIELVRGFGIPGITEVPIGPSWRKFFLDLLLFLKALIIALFGGFKLFHGIEEGAWIAGFLGIIFRKPYIVDMDSCIIEQLQASGFISGALFLGILARMETFFIRHASGILTVCSALTEKARKLAGDTPIYQIEDIPVSSSTEVNQNLLEELKKEYNLINKRVIAYTGNFQPYQGVEILIRAFAKCKQTGASGYCDNLILLLVGGEGDNDPLLIKHQKLAEELGISSSVIFTGRKPIEQMGTFMALGDALISPRCEGGNTPLKVYSYMASGRPIIASRLETHTQVLDDTTAFLGEPSVEGLSQQIEKAFAPGAEHLRKQIADAAKTLVNTRYSVEVFKTKLSELYKEVLG